MLCNCLNKVEKSGTIKIDIKDDFMKIIKSLLPYVIIIVVVIVIRTFFVTPVRVNGSSMYPTLKGGEIMLLNKLGKIDRFDIVVLKLDTGEDNLIKRVIGMPGETVQITDNKIYVNDKVLEENFGVGITYDIDKVTLKDDEYFVLGDNRIISMDSRVFGTINKEEIKGTTNFVLYPFKSFGKVK